MQNCHNFHFLFSCFSAISKTERKQEELVWSQSLCGSDGRRPVQKDREVHKHAQSQMEAATHCVSWSHIGFNTLMSCLIRQLRNIMAGSCNVFHHYISKRSSVSCIRKQFHCTNPWILSCIFSSWVHLVYVDMYLFCYYTYILHCTMLSFSLTLYPPHVFFPLSLLTLSFTFINVFNWHQDISAESQCTTRVK